MSATEPPQVDRLPHIRAVDARLAAISQDPPVSRYIGKPTKVPLIAGTESVQRYTVFYPFFGNPSLEQDLARATRDVDWLLQVSCFAHTFLDCFALARDIDALLHGWTPAVAGYSAGPLRPPEGYDPGPPREDDSVKPSRWLLPLQYRTRITRHVSA